MSVRELSYTVAGMSCGHCKAAVTEEVELVAGVDAVEVDLDSKRVVVRGENLSDEAVRAAIVEAGYEAA
jgi:copper chaperone